MANFTLNNISSSFSKRFYKVALISFIFACICSYCSSLPFPSSGTDVHQLSDGIDEFYDDHRVKSYLPIELFPSHIMYTSNHEIRPPKAHIFLTLLQSLLTQYPDYQHGQYNDKRYASQPFYAMRG